MKLTAFKARGVHGYLAFDIRFDRSLTFLIGPNGCGKSTALRLMEAMITPSLEYITSVSFDYAELIFDHFGEKVITAIRAGEIVKIAASWVEGSLEINDLSRRVENVLVRDSRDFASQLAFEYAANPVLRAIAEIPAPLFLGIDRQERQMRDTSAISESALDEIEWKKAFSASRRNRGEVIDGLLASQLLVRDAYRRSRRQQDAAQGELREKVLLSIFEYSSSNSFHEAASPTDLERIDSETSAIAQALVALGVNPVEVQQKRMQFTGAMADLFRRMELAGAKQDNNSPSPVIDYLMNQANLGKMQATIDVIKKFNEKSKRIFRRIDSFKEALNWFVADSRKSMDIDEVGRMRLTRPDKQFASLDHLSSGERQIIVIFSHIFFNTHGQNSKIFVIDEPELSLHARWQENLVDKILAASQDTQLIFATHSPDIVNAHDEKCVELLP